MIVMAKDPETKTVKKRWPAGPCPRCGSNNTRVTSSGDAGSDYRWIKCDSCGRGSPERKPR